MVKFETDNGPVCVEVATPKSQKPGVQKAGLRQDAKKIIQSATFTFEAALENAFVAANRVRKQADTTALDTISFTHLTTAVFPPKASMCIIGAEACAGVGES